MRPRRWMMVLWAVCLVWTAAPAVLGAEKEESRMVAETFSGLELRGIGPAMMSGRIADIAIDPRDQSTWYVAVGSGGVWKTTNAGTTWDPIFDDQGSYSIGCITLDPRRPDVVWVGTGENVGGRHVGYGDGIYRSLDGGESWEHRGLSKSEHIGTILVHPEDSDVLYVASQGPLWSAGGERGLYKTVDGGETWERILGGGEYTGVNEVRMDPRDPDVLYAATHQRYRNVAALVNGGPETGIHKSLDGGKTWRELSNGLPDDDMGKIGLAISPQQPDVIYATIELAHREGGFYRSADGGETWEKKNDYLSGGTGPHYYQEIFASPHRFDRVYQMDVWMHVTEDGGDSFRRLGEQAKHSDNHALAFDPKDPEYLLAGSDGGLYESWDLGQTWKFIANLPVTQYYKVAVDYDEPFYNLYGGTQDNSTQGGPSRTTNVNGIRNSDWFITLFADGHQPAVDPTNPDIVYSEWQQGNLVRYDRKNGEFVHIQPQPDDGEPAERWNWDSPILISPHDPARLYFASQRLWRSDNRGDAWRPVSPDLTKGGERLRLPMMGRVQSYDAIWDLWAMSNYGTITSISESPVVEGLLYVGTDDGFIQVSEDGGANWNKVERFGNVPSGAFVNDIKADLHDADTVYAAFDDHKSGDFAPYLVKSTDRGRTWKSIASDLPDRHLVWRLVQDHVEPGLLFAGTEMGVFFTVDGGDRWIELTGGVPNIPFRDLAIQQRENDLVGATFGRGFFIFDDYTPLRQISEEALGEDALLFPVRKAWWYVPQRPLGQQGQASMGDAFYLAPNPPFGAVFTYYLREGLQSRQESRREEERALAEKGKDTPHPGWDALREEDREETPAIVLTVRDTDGQVVRRLRGPVSEGFHRVAWDLRYPPVDAWDEEDADDDGEENPGGSWLAAPGTYSVEIGRRVEGAYEELVGPQSFQVTPLGERTLPGMEPAALAEFLKGVGDLQRRANGVAGAVGEAGRSLAAMRGALLQSTVDDEALEGRVRELERTVYDLREMLFGPVPQNRIGEPTAPAIFGRIGVVGIGNAFSTYGPTQTHERSLEIARRDLAQVRETLGTVLTEIAEIGERLEEAGVPWTPGRGVPSL